MVKRRIGYLLLLAVGFYFMMLYDFQGLRFLMCCIVCLPLASFMLLAPKAFLCRVSVETGQNSVTRGELLKIRVRVENKGRLPLARVRISILWEAPGEKKVQSKRWLYGFGRGCEEVELELSAPHCGEAYFAITRARVGDYLGLFTLPVRKGVREALFCITPVITPVDREDVAALGTLTGMLAGEDGDVAVREYWPGDSLHRVYWKLSVKVGELQIRETQEDGSMRIFLKYSEDFRSRAREWDKYLDRACSLLCFLTEESQNVRTVTEVVWRQGDGYWKYELDDIASLWAWLSVVLTKKGGGNPLEENEIPFLESGYQFREDGRLYWGEQCVYE